MTIGERLSRFRPRANAVWQRVQRPAHFVLLASVVALLLYDLSATGWRAVVKNLPTTPWFYAIFLINYCGMPFFEAMIYNLLWKTGPRILPVLLQKRVYNEAVLDYSGETFLFVWARTHTRADDREILSNVRDVNVLSALAGNLVTCLILVAVIVIQADKLGVGDAEMLRRGALFTGGSVLVLVALAAVFRKWLLSLSLAKCAAISGLHILRLITFLALQAFQWHVAVPIIGWQTWVTFLALQMAVSRLPLLPAKDLFFAGLAMNLGARMALAPAVIGGLFVAASGINLIVHAVMYVLAHVFGPKAPPGALPAGPDDAPPAPVAR
jgi:hypothetical protein